MMKKAIILVALFLFQSILGQEDYSKYKPIELLYNNGGVEKFYQYLSQTIDFTKVANEKNVIIGFVLDKQGKMNHIKVAFCTSIEAEKEIMSALQKANNWDLSNQRNKDLFIGYKMKLIFLDKEIKGLTKTSWFKDDVVDMQIDKDEFEIAREVVSTDAEKIYNSAVIEVKPEYPGGISAFIEHISKNYNVPKVQGLKGKILVSFVVEKDGSLNSFKILKDIGYGSGEEAIRVLKLSKKWAPARQSGVPVRSSYLIPISIETR